MLDLPGFGRSGHANAQVRARSLRGRAVAGDRRERQPGRSTSSAIRWAARSRSFTRPRYPEQVRRLIVVDAAGILHRDAWFGHHLRRVTDPAAPGAAARGRRAGRGGRRSLRHVAALRSGARSGAGAGAAAAEDPGRQARADRRARADPAGLRAADRAHPRADAGRVGRRRHGRAAAHRADAGRSVARRAAGRDAGRRSPGDGAGAERCWCRRSSATSPPGGRGPRAGLAARHAGQGASATASRTSS